MKNNLSLQSSSNQNHTQQINSLNANQNFMHNITIQNHFTDLAINPNFKQEKQCFQELITYLKAFSVNADPFFKERYQNFEKMGLQALCNNNYEQLTKANFFLESLFQQCYSNCMMDKKKSLQLVLNECFAVFEQEKRKFQKLILYIDALKSKLVACNLTIISAFAEKQYQNAQTVGINALKNNDHEELRKANMFLQGLFQIRWEDIEHLFYPEDPLGPTPRIDIFED